MRSRSTAVSLLLFFFCLTLTSSLSLNESDRRPNIVLVLLDDAGWGDVSFNNPATTETPNLQV